MRARCLRGAASPERPPGLYFIALVAEGYERVGRYVFAGDRQATKQQAAEAALRLVLDYLDATAG